jgi:hypothetical protein
MMDGNMEEKIAEVCERIYQTLIKKNKSYGNASQEPINIFFKGSNLDALNVNIDNKLKRIKNGSEFENEDTELDLIGYMILKICIKELEEKESKK